jgi:hypothetical protein
MPRPFRQRRLAAEARGEPFPSYAGALEQFAEELQRLDRSRDVDVAPLFDRVFER